MSGAHLNPRAELLVYPQLLKSDLTAALNLLLPFACFFRLHLDSTLRAAMFKLNFRAESPATAEVESKHDNGVRQIETVVTFRILIVLRLRVSVHIVAIEISSHHSLAISSKRKARLKRAFARLAFLLSRRRCYSCSSDCCVAAHHRCGRSNRFFNLFVIASRIGWNNRSNQASRQ